MLLAVLHMHMHVHAHACIGSPTRRSRLSRLRPDRMFSCVGPARALVRRPAHAHAHARLRQLATKIFDGTLKAHHRERAALAPDFGNYSYLHEEVARRLLDRLDDIHESYEFSDAVDLSCGPGHVRRLLEGRGVERMLEFDSSGAAALRRYPAPRSLHARSTHAPAHRSLPSRAAPSLSLSLHSLCTSLCRALRTSSTPSSLHLLHLLLLLLLLLLHPVPRSQPAPPPSPCPSVPTCNASACACNRL